MKKHIQKTFVRQQDEKDCGVACLLSALAYHHSGNTFERLRELSGTHLQGTSLLGLCQAARQVGFEAEGLEAESIDQLKEVPHLCILYVRIDNQLPHYVLYYGYEKNTFVVGDPACGIRFLTAAELGQIWQQQLLIQLVPTDRIVKQTDNRKQRKEWLLALLKEDYPILLIGAVLGIILAVLGLGTAIFSQRLVDKILPEHQTNAWLTGMLLLTLILVIRSALGYLRSLFMIRQSRDFNTRLMNDFFTRLLFLPKSFFDTRKTGEFMARMNDSQRIQTVVAMLTGNIAIDILVVGVSVGFLFTYTWIIGLIVLGSIPLYGLLMWKFTKPLLAAQREVMQAHSYTEAHYIHTLQGIGTIKNMSQESFFAQLTQQVYGVLQTRAYNLGKLSLRYGWWSEMATLLLTVAVMGFASWMVLHNTLKTGELMAILSLAGSVFPAVGRLISINVHVQEVAVVVERLFEFTILPPEYTDSRLPAKTRQLEFQKIHVEEICFRFPGRAPLLKNIQATFEKGKLTVISGESGSGKSIFFQILQRFYSSETGQVHVDGTDWKEIPLSVWRASVGVVPQEITLFPGSLLYNICLKTVDEAEASELAAFLCEYGFDSFFSRFPQGYQTLLGEAGVALSGGQKQLVALARALYRKPALLLLDEATSALDRQTEVFVLHLLEKLKSEMAIVLITHRIHSMQHADVHYVLEEGCLYAVSQMALPD